MWGRGIWVGNAARAAVAATLAWFAVMPFGGFADDYPYYAPFGAVVVATSTLAGGARETIRMSIAILIGAVLALATSPFDGIVQLALVVGVGTFVGSWKRLGGLAGMGSWVPIVGLFVLIIGQGQALWEYAAAYVGLTTLGAVIALLVNLVWPPLPVDATSRAVKQLRETIIAQLRQVSEALQREKPPTSHEWGDMRGHVDRELHRMREQLYQLQEARKGNWRARRWESYSNGADQDAQTLDALAFFVEDLRAMLAHRETADLEEVVLGPKLRPLAARVLGDLSDLLDAYDDHEHFPDRRRETEESLARLVDLIRDRRQATGDEHIVATGLVTNVRRTLDTLSPPTESAA